MSTDGPKRDLDAFYGRYLRRCDEHRFNVLGEFVAECVNASPTGLGDYVAGLRAVIEGFADYRWEPRRLLVDEPFLAAHLQGTGTHTGAFRGIAPTGRSISTQELVMYRVSGGRIVEYWGDLGSAVRDELISGPGHTAV